MILIPAPKKLKINQGEFNFPSKLFISIPTKSLLTSAKMLKKELKNIGIESFISLHNGEKTVIESKINRSKIKKHSGYILTISNKKIEIAANNVAGIHYAFMTLIQIIKNFGPKIPQLEIFDFPSIKNRGYLLDISRDKVPKLETLFYIVDLLAQLKFNQLQLYIEHTFSYQDHEKVWKDYSPLSGEDVILLDNYCKERFIELVPNQASFGHMEKWLTHNEYSYLAETFEFDTPWGEHYNTPFSLSPVIEDSIKFLDSLYNELLPHFSSKYFNINGDETFDLCQGKSKKLCEKMGKGKVYLDFILKIYNLLKKYNKKMMMWADIIKNYPELVNEIPNDITFLIWGYEKNHPFEDECKLFKNRKFYACPGTSSWNSLIGRFENSILNIKNASENAIKFKASGLLLTDWGDNGHWQHFPISLPAIFYSAGVFWGFEENKDINIENAISLYFEKEVAEILIAIGNAYKLTGIDFPNSAIFALVYIYPDKINKDFLEKISIENLILTKQFLEEQLQKASKINDSLIKEEIKNNIELSILATELLISTKKVNVSSISNLPSVTKEEFSIRLEKLIENYKKIWLSRNRSGGLKFSIEKLSKIKKLL
ncbi:beta-N-acetylhexosaminidase [Thermosipho globiformans]|uniref:beta-N-acetylhexosaminidase n=1 Tax=Thermosipho globiformans TaxID=380685 RepID=UPI000F8C8C8E|nr:family 20 glycosylhydrolase [Thermosipho globiformans]